MAACQPTSYESVGVIPQIMSAIVPMLRLAGTYFLTRRGLRPGEIYCQSGRVA